MINTSAYTIFQTLMPKTDSTHSKVYIKEAKLSAQVLDLQGCETRQGLEESQEFSVYRNTGLTKLCSKGDSPQKDWY